MGRGARQTPAGPPTPPPLLPAAAFPGAAALRRRSLRAGSCAGRCPCRLVEAACVCARKGAARGFPVSLREPRSEGCRQRVPSAALGSGGLLAGK